MIQAGVRRRRSTQPRVEPTGNDGSIVRYNCQGVGVDTKGTIGCGSFRRFYIGGFQSGNMLSNAGIDVTGYYSSARFLPGCKIRWEPSCSFTTSGRVYAGFTDNPEVAATLSNLRDTFSADPTPANYTAYAGGVRALGSTISFPVWQETEVNFPQRTRRKRFDTDVTPSGSVDNLDRTMQQAMFVAVEGGPTENQILGNFWFHDVVDVEGLQSVAT